MEKPDTTIPETLPEMSGDSVTKKSKLASIGFVCMLAGPAILILASIFTSMFGHISGTVAGIVALIAALLPGIGFIISCIILFSLSFRETTGKLGLGLAIVTMLTCNPLFYLAYLGICAVAILELSGAFLGGM